MPITPALIYDRQQFTEYKIFENLKQIQSAAVHNRGSVSVSQIMQCTGVQGHTSTSSDLCRYTANQTGWWYKKKKKKKFITGGLIHLPQVLQGIKNIGKLHCKSLPLAAVMTAMLGWHNGVLFLLADHKYAGLYFQKSVLNVLFWLHKLS